MSHANRRDPPYAPNHAPTAGRSHCLPRDAGAAVVIPQLTLQPLRGRRLARAQAIASASTAPRTPSQSRAKCIVGRTPNAVREDARKNPA